MHVHQKFVQLHQSRSRAARHVRQSGFTLLEVMISVAILALGLMWLMDATARAIAAANHAKTISTATFLARARLVELEDELHEKGFTDDAFATETTGDCDKEGVFKRFKCTVSLEKVEMPSTEQVQSAMGKAMTDRQTLAGGAMSDPAAAQQSGGMGGGASMMSMGAGLLSSQFGLIKDVLEQGIRKAHVTVTWEEFKKQKSVEVTEYLTDPHRIDMAIGGTGIPGANGQNGQNGQNNNSPNNNPQNNPLLPPKNP